MIACYNNEKCPIFTYLFFMYRKLIYILLTFIFLHMGLCGNGQITITDLTRITREDGLSDNNIKGITQDERGYLWIATENGLNRYDGKEFKKFYRGNTTTSLPGNNISYIFNFGPDTLGISTRQGFQLLNTKTLASKNYTFPDTSIFSAKLNHSWYAIRMEGNKIGLTTSVGFYVYNPDGSVYFKYEHFKQEDSGKKVMRYGKEIFSMGNSEYLIMTQDKGYAYFNLASKKFINAADKSTNPYPQFANRIISRNCIADQEFLLLQYTTDTLVYYNNRTKKTTYTKLPYNVYKNTSWVAKINRYTDSSFLLNTLQGFYELVLNRQTGSIRIIHKNLLPKLKVFCHFTDKEGRLWIGTENGLYMQKKNTPIIQSIKIDHPKNSDHFVSALYRYKGKYYVGNASKGDSSLWIIDSATKKVERKLFFYDIGSDWNEIISIQNYYDDSLWIGTRKGILWYSILSHKYGKVDLKNEDKKLKEIYFSVLGNKNNAVAWIASIGSTSAIRYNIKEKTYNSFTPNTKPPIRIADIKHIITDSYGNTWLAGNGLQRFNEKTLQFDTAIKVFGGSNKFNGNVVSIAADNNGSLWLQTADNDFLEYRIKQKSFKVYGEKDGFPPGAIEAISSVNGSLLWLHQKSRLLLFNTKTHRLIIFGPKDGVPDDRLTSERLSYDKEANSFYACYKNRFSIIPASISTSKTRFRLVINELNFNNKKSVYHPDSIVVTSYKENEVMLGFSVIDFEDGTDYLYYYSIDDNPIIYLDKQNILRLGKLENGNHVITIKTNAKNGEELFATITIRVKNPFWKQPWFMIATALLLISIFYVIYKNRVGNIKKAASINQKMLTYEMTALQAQMNRHFIFNSLNSIKELIVHGHNDEASRYLSKFGHLIRLTLDSNTRNFISLSENNEQLIAYLEMEELRFNNFTWKIVVNENVDVEETLVVPMLIQPILENAIWHGLLQYKGRKNLLVSFTCKDNQLYCTIDDNGIGIKASLAQKGDSNYKSIGLKNIEERLEVLRIKYNQPYNITIVDKSDLQGITASGTMVTIEMPLLHKNS